MNPDYRYVFISYSTENYDFAMELKNLLSINNISCWMAPQSIPAGSDYSSEIPEAIENCSIFILVLSEASQNSKWVPKELDLAITYGKTVIPFHMDASALKSAFNFRLTNVQRIEAYGRFTEACSEMIQQIFALWGISQGTVPDSSTLMSETIGEIREGKLIAGKYKVIQKVGTGCLTEVYLAENVATGKQWAIKVISMSSGNKEAYGQYSKLLSTELMILNKLKHVNIPAIADVIQDGRVLVVIMEYCDGSSLGQIINSNGPVCEDQVIEWAKQMCGVVDYLQSQKPMIIHNDIKPDNILLKQNGQIVLIDFGAAQEYTEGQTEIPMILGTPGYTAPELLRGKNDSRSDIFSVGATLYYLATGQSPAQPPYGIYPIRQMNPQLSLGLEYIIEKCTKLNPDERYQSAQELLADLNQIDALSLRLKKKTFIRKFFRFGK